LKGFGTLKATRPAELAAHHLGQKGDGSVKPAIRRAILSSGIAAAIVAGVFFRDELLAVVTSLRERGPQVVLDVEPNGGDLQHAVEESIRVLERRFYDLAVRASVRRQGPA
jgi:hypothetical protein